MKTAISFILLVVTIGCASHTTNPSTDDSTDPGTGTITDPIQQPISNRIEFYLTDNQGNQRTSFNSSDTIVFIYTFKNDMGKDIGWAMSHGGPWVRFHIQQDTLIFADSYQGGAFPLNAPSGTIKNGEIIGDQWVFRLSNNPLPSGIYTTYAFPEILLFGIGGLPNESITFSIN
jgi:hypothetical protein